MWFTEAAGDKIGTDRLHRENHRVPASHADAEPNGIVTGSDGNIWFSETHADKIGKLVPSTGAITEYTLPTANAEPMGVALGSEGNVWFAEYGSSKVGYITPAGTITEDGTLFGDDNPLYLTASAGEGTLHVVQRRQPAITSATSDRRRARRRDDLAEIPGRDGHRHRHRTARCTSRASNRTAPTRSTGSRTCRARSQKPTIPSYTSASGSCWPTPTSGSGTCTTSARARRSYGSPPRGSTPTKRKARSPRTSPTAIGNQPARVPARADSRSDPIKQSGSRTSRPTRSASTPRTTRLHPQFAVPLGPEGKAVCLEGKAGARRLSTALRRQSWTRRQSGRRPERDSPQGRS